MIKENLIERIAKIEHEQWVSWSKDIAKVLQKAKNIISTLIADNENLSETEKYSKFIDELDSRLKRWENFWVSYENLPESVKELDRIWARKVVNELIGKL